MYKMGVFDLDGTLLNDNHEISIKNLKAIRGLQKNGYKIIIATGRPEALIKEYIGIIKVLDYLIACNGAVVKDINNNITLINQFISAKYVKSILDTCQKFECINMVYTDKAIVSTDNYRLEYLEKRNEKLKEEYKTQFIKTDDTNIISKKYKANKILIIEHDEKKYLKIYEMFKNIKEIEITKSSSGFIDIMASGVSKKNSLEKLVRRCNYKREDIVAFGDNYNDIDMLKYAGCAITTKNGVQKVKEICNYVSKSNNEDGVAYAINKYLHIESD